MVGVRKATNSIFFRRWGDQQTLCGYIASVIVRGNIWGGSSFMISPQLVQDPWELNKEWQMSPISSNWPGTDRNLNPHCGSIRKPCRMAERNGGQPPSCQWHLVNRKAKQPIFMKSSDSISEVCHSQQAPAANIIHIKVSSLLGILSILLSNRTMTQRSTVTIQRCEPSPTVGWKN